MAEHDDLPRAPVAPRPPLRVAVGVGDAENERRLLAALGAAGVVVAERCVSAEQLLGSAHRGRVDALLAGLELHRLTDDALEELARTRVPLVLLAPPARAAEDGLPGLVLRADADPGAVAAALGAAARGERTAPRRGRVGTPSGAVPPAAPEAPSAVLAVASGPGSPGRTTVAVSLAAALGACAPTALVDSDALGPAVCAHLRLDPQFNVAMVARAEPATERDWDRALADELQPLGGRSPRARVLCGVPKPELRGTLSRAFLERLVGALRRRYAYVVLDVGALLLGDEGAPHRAALALADRVLLVATPDLLGLWRARQALAQLDGPVGVPRERVALVLNRHDRRRHWGRSEVERELGRPTAALVPHDHAAAQAAAKEQRPLVLDPRSRAGRALLGLAERVHGGRLLLPPEPPPGEGPGWRRWIVVPRPPWRRAPTAATAPGGGPDGDRAAVLG